MASITRRYGARDERELFLIYISLFFHLCFVLARGSEEQSQRESIRKRKAGKAKSG
jgi:hypothetical protein